MAVFAWAVIRLTRCVGKCRQSSAAQRHDGWRVCRHCWTVDAIISWGRKRESRATQESDKGWLTKPNQRSLLDGTALKLLASHCESQCISLVTAESCDRKPKIKCVSFMKWGRGGEKNFPVIRDISHTCWGSTPAEIRWFKPVRGGVIAAAAADKILNSTRTHTDRLPLNRLSPSAAANSASDSDGTTALPEMQRRPQASQRDWIRLDEGRKQANRTCLAHRLEQVIWETPENQPKCRFYSGKRRVLTLITEHSDVVWSGIHLIFEEKSKTCRIQM